MLRWCNRWSAVALCVALTLLAAPAALGQSAGNQQYIDPLGSTTPTAPASTGSPPAQSSSPAPTAPAASSSAQSSSDASSTVTDTSTSAAPASASARTLPFTGLDLWPAVAVGFGLIASGLALRRAVRRT